MYTRRQARTDAVQKLTPPRDVCRICEEGSRTGSGSPLQLNSLCVCMVWAGCAGSACEDPVTLELLLTHTA